MRHDHRQHPGELFVQQQLGVPLGVSPSAYVSDEMPRQHALFFSNLLYFAICTLDQHGRVWSTILVGSGETLSPIRALDVETLVGEAQVAPGDPFTDGVVGLVIPCFQSGDLVHVTGTAENLFNEAAEAHALPLQMIGPEMLSPYNPPLRLLASELKSRGVEPTQAQVLSARLTDVQCMSRAISAFTFELSAPVSFLPGSFAIFDFSRHIPRVYRHMNQLNPQQVNDDHIRTWTISSAPPYDALTRSFRPTNRITCTVKRVDGGAVTPFLHGAAPSLVVPFRGVGGAFSIYSAPSTESPVRVKHRKMLWIAGGVGVTPFLSFANSRLNAVDPSAEVIVLFAARGDEAALGLSVFSQCPFVTQLTVFDSAPLEHHVTGDSPLTAARVHRRIELRDLTAIADLQERAVSLCGPPTFMDAVGSLLQRAGVASSRIDREEFTF
ncbi:hypothetical protein P43SY_008995 [Pythium insidiosum]|uniref:FAD-binding FR-type domain-containing protein n=1 Tax=Pythium insidiosum TaxID=114742 RepID=A0AAD5Q662_PYTIN|nr:hypothetical protein P43SY_008995 [Pythium insidiosum]